MVDGAGVESVILANGLVPEHERPLSALRRAKRIICCDGAADKLVSAGFEPAWIVGDMDSLSDALRVKYSDIIIASSDQETNDLTKAFNFCLARGWSKLLILGATGEREDHTLANLSLLADYGVRAEVRLMSDSGVFTPIYGELVLEAEVGQQISFFAVESGTRLWVEGVRYVVDGLVLSRWWVASLNEAVAERVRIRAEGGPVLVFQSY